MKTIVALAIQTNELLTKFPFTAIPIKIPISTILFSFQKKKSLKETL